MSNEKTFEDTDEFWSLDALLPKKEKPTYLPTSRDTSASELEIGGGEPEAKGERIPKRQYPPITERPKTKSFDEWLGERKRYEEERFTRGKIKIDEYVPDNPLIKRVTVSADPSARKICERFLVDAYRLYDAECEFKGNVPFFSYYPQYSQMNAAQIECYIGFRTDIRNGIYDKVDIAYIYLYLYELINTPSRSSPEKRAAMMCELIKAYHDLDIGLFANMCNWLCDLCLIHRVKLKKGVFGDLTVKVASVCRIKEFFLGNDALVSRDYALIAAVTAYDYKKSRFYTDNREAYDAIIPKAVASAIDEMSKNDSRFLKENESVCTLIHESYNGALCSGAVRCTISIECVCITRSETVKKAISETVKYAENCLRALLGIKPRLTVNYLSTEYKAVIKGYFSEQQTYKIKPRKPKGSVAAPEKAPEYEALYEPQSNGVSFEEAKEIEESSWEITSRLVADTETEEAVTEPTFPAPAPKAETGRSSELTGLGYVLEKDVTSFNALARSLGLLPDAFADDINAFALEKIGDIVLIPSETGYDIVEDYITDIKSILSESGSV